MNNIIKSISATLLATAIALPILTSCAKGPKEIIYADLSVEKDGEDVSSFLSTEKSNTVEAYVFSGYEKILSEEQFNGATTQISVYAAKNESESIVTSLFATSEERLFIFSVISTSSHSEYSFSCPIPSNL